MIIFFSINIFILILLSILYNTFSIFIIGIFGLILVLGISKGCERKVYNSLSIIFIISITLMLVLFYGYIAKYAQPYYLGGSDDKAFEETSQLLIDLNYYMPEQLMGNGILRFHNSKGFLWILSWIMRISCPFGGYHTITYRVLNIYFLMSLGILVFKFFSKKYKFSLKHNLIVLYSMTLFPNIQYITMHVFRDTINILLLFSIFYILDKLFSKTQDNLLIPRIALILILTYVSFWVRVENIIFIAGLFLISIFLKDNKTANSKSLMKYISMAVVVIFLLNYFEVLDQIAKVNDRYSDYILSDSSGISTTVFSTKLFPFGIVLRIIYGVIFPVPVYILKIFKIFSDIDIFFKVIISIGVIAQIYFLPYLIKNIKFIDKVTVVFLMFFLGIVVTTFTFRHFIMVYPFMAILMFRQYFDTTKSTKILLFANMTIVLSVFACMYLLVK